MRGFRARIGKPFISPGIEFQPGGPVWYDNPFPYLTYLSARLHRLAESIPGLLQLLQIRAQARIHFAVHIVPAQQYPS